MKCRFCLKGSPSTNLFQLDLHIVRFIRDMLKIEEGSYDSYEMICKSCVGKLKNMEKFLTLCRESDEYWKNIATVTIKTETDLYTQTDITSYSCDDVKVETALMEIKYMGQEDIKTIDKYSEYHEEVYDNEPEIDTEDLDVAIEPKDEKYNPFQCTVCPTISSCKTAYERHIKKHNFPFICSLCPGKYKTETNYFSHINIHNSDTILYCPACNIAFDSKKKLKRHAISIHKGDDKTLDTINNFKILRGKKHMSESLLCPTCGKSFSTNSSLWTHVQIHSSNIFQCDVCNKKFNRRDCIINHLYSHRSDTPSACELCPKKFKSNALRNAHVKTVHLKKRKYKPGQCHICNKLFRCSSSLKYHKAIHANERSEECSVCHKRFRSKTTLRSHLRHHSKERPYTCSFCGSSFKDPKSVKEHERLHTGETPYKCPVCLRGYAQRCNMKSHFVHNHKELDYKQEMEKYKLKMKQTST